MATTITIGSADDAKSNEGVEPTQLQFIIHRNSNLIL